MLRDILKKLRHATFNSTHENNTVNIMYLLCTVNREMNELPNFRLKMAL